MCTVLPPPLAALLMIRQESVGEHKPIVARRLICDFPATNFILFSVFILLNGSCCYTNKTFSKKFALAFCA